MKFTVATIIGTTPMTKQEGEQLYDLIYPLLKEGQEVELDFTNVEIVTSWFLNPSLGRLYKSFSPDEIDRLVKISNFLPADKDVLNRVKGNALKYYTQETTHKAVNAALEQHLNSI